MEVKRCTERYLEEVGLNYTILRPCGFLQGSIGQYAVPVLDRQSIWITKGSAPTAFIDTQDAAKFAVRALSSPATERKSFPLVGPQAWTPNEIVALCERLSGQQARITPCPLPCCAACAAWTSFFQWSWNISDRLAFTEVLVGDRPLDAPMDEVYQAFDLDPADTTTLEDYLQEYFSRILTKLKELKLRHGESEAARPKARSFLNQCNFRALCCQQQIARRPHAPFGKILASTLGRVVFCGSTNLTLDERRACRKQALFTTTPNRQPVALQRSCKAS